MALSIFWLTDIAPKHAPLPPPSTVFLAAFLGFFRNFAESYENHRHYSHHNQRATGTDAACRILIAHHGNRHSPGRSRSADTNPAPPSCGLRHRNQTVVPQRPSQQSGAHAGVHRRRVVSLPPQPTRILSADERICGRRRHAKGRPIAQDDFHVMHRNSDFEPRGFIDLQKIVTQWRISDTSLQKIYGILFGLGAYPKDNGSATGKLPN